MNNAHDHQENHSYLLWPVAVLLFLTIGVLVTSGDTQVVIGTSLVDIRLAFVLLFLFIFSLLFGILFFLKKIH